MNGSCAGSTSAFIDQMATLLKMTPEELNGRGPGRKRPLPSPAGAACLQKATSAAHQPGRGRGRHCGLDLRGSGEPNHCGPGAGRPIAGNILYLGGPLTFNSVLRQSFDKALGAGALPGAQPAFVALGAAFLRRQRVPACRGGGPAWPMRARAAMPASRPCSGTGPNTRRFSARHLKASRAPVAFGGRVRPGAHWHRRGLHHRKAGGDRPERAPFVHTDYQPNLGNPCR